MSEQHISVDQGHREREDNIFDKYYSLIEETHLDDISDEKFLYKYLVNGLAIVERNLIDLSYDSNRSKSNLHILNVNIERCLTEWYPILTSLMFDSSFVKALSYNFFGLSLVINNSLIDISEIEICIMYLSPSIDFDDRKDDAVSHYLKHRSPSQYNFNRKLSNDIDIESGCLKIIGLLDYKAFKIDLLEISDESKLDSLREISKKLNIVNLIDNYRSKLEKTIIEEWLLTVYTSDNKPNAVGFLKLVYTFIATLKYINEDDIEITLENWGNGSKWAEFRIKFKSWLSKQETKEVLDKARKAVEAELFDKRIGEADKLKAEANKIQKEADNILSKNDVEESNKLDLELKRLTILEKNIDVKEKALNLRIRELEAIDKVSDMISKKVLNHDSNLQIQINNLLYFENETNKPSINSIDLLDARSSTKPNSSSDEDQVSNEKL